jgi:hypothetical protein
MTPPRLLIEDWLPAQAIGVECMRENSSASAARTAPTGCTSGGRAGR